MNIIKRYYADTLEIILSLLFIQGGVRVLAEQPVVFEHPLDYLTGPLMVVAYGIMWVLIGAALLNAKYFHLKTLHKHSLLAMFITCFYVLCLALVIEGPQPGHLLTIICGIVSGFLWLRWKLKTEYVKPEEFKDAA